MTVLSILARLELRSGFFRMRSFACSGVSWIGTSFCWAELRNAISILLSAIHISGVVDGVVQVLPLIEMSLFNGLRAIVVATLQYGTRPFSEQLFGLALDAKFRLLTLGIEENDFPNAARDESLFINGKVGERGKDFSLNVVGRQASVVEWL